MVGQGFGDLPDHSIRHLFMYFFAQLGENLRCGDKYDPFKFVAMRSLVKKLSQVVGKAFFCELMPVSVVVG